MGRRSENGSALMLVPAGMLILIVLASISVDSAIAFSGRRQLENEVAAAANDAATLAIPRDATSTGFQGGDSARPDPRVVQEIAERKVLHPYSGGLVATAVRTEVTGTTVTITAEGTVTYIFAKAIPGARHRTTVRAQVSADLRFS